MFELKVESQMVEVDFTDKLINGLINYQKQQSEYLLGN